MLDVQEAIERGELGLHYQPIVSLRSGDIVGFEGLVRWQHPQRGLLLPDSFLPLAKDEASMQAVTMWAVQKGCEEARCLQQAAFAQTPVLSINVSSGFLKREELVEEFICRTLEANLPPETLAVEVSEPQVMTQLAAMRKPLELLRSYGILIYLDHFGTGFSSIRALADLPIVRIKVDRSFVEGMQHARRDQQILSALLSVGRSLEKQLIAVGVENAEQVQFLKNGQCELAQGNYFAAALEVSAALWLRRVGAPKNDGKQVDCSRLRCFELFRGVPEKQLDALAGQSGERDFACGAVIIRQGQAGREMYLLEQGTIEVYRENHHSVVPLVQLQAPIVFGEMAVINPERIRTANVRALSDVRVVAIPVDALVSSFHDCPPLKDKLRQMVAERTSR